MTYVMQIEKTSGLETHPFHLGTDFKVAEDIALEMLGRKDVITVALKRDGKIVRIYDYRDMA